jgi:hypothetical protein
MKRLVSSLCQVALVEKSHLTLVKKSQVALVEKSLLTLVEFFNQSLFSTKVKCLNENTSFFIKPSDFS